MIKCDAKTKESTIHGAEPVILAEYATLTQHFMDVLTEKNGKDRAKDLLQSSFDLAFKTDEEIETEIKKMSSELTEAIMDKLVEKLLSGGFRCGRLI